MTRSPLSIFLALGLIPYSLSHAETVIRVTPEQSLTDAVKQAQTAAKPVKIELAAGRYELSAPLVLTGAHSGLTFSAAGDARPVIAGSVRVKNWKLADVARGLWQAGVPDAKDGKWQPRQMFVDGKRAQRARTPNEGFLHARGGLPQTKPFAFPAEPGSLKPEWAARGDVELVFYQKWIDARLVIKSIDPAANTALLNAHARDWMSEGNCRYFIENAPDALDATGEWHLDRKSGVISYLAPKGWEAEKSLVTLPRTGTLLTLQNGNGVTIRGVTFAETDYPLPDDGRIDPQAASTVRGTVRAINSTDCIFEDCTIDNAGGYALDLGEGCRRWRVAGNSLRNSGAGGIRIGESGKTNPAGEISFIDNIIAHYGRIHPAGVGVLIMQSGKNRIAHNLIHDGFYTGISVGWTWGYTEGPCRENIIEFNHVHTIGQGLLSDMGGIYTLGPQPGTVIRSNYFHDIVSHDYGGWGLYTDEGSSNILLENNLVARCKSAGFHQHYGKDNIVRNNVFAWNKEHSIMRSREEEHNSFTFEHNIVVANSGSLMGNYWTNDHFTIDHNCYWDTRHGANAEAYQFLNTTLPKWRERKHDVHTILQDPGIPAEGMPVPQNQTAAAAIGFKIEDLPKAEQLGPRPRKERK
ncbi:MAG TPA: right-handed parallel beta-helix repeat-containing protein [Verrucomicrobiales bacterium]|nr:right-handed parallel beta-helix repeat-containing protein [Verrucomicrobiales bacterium]